MENTVMFQRGPFVILFIFGLSAVMGGFAVWTHYQQGRHCLEFWGSEAANLIRHAPRVEYLKLGDRNRTPGPADEFFEIGGKKFGVERRLDVSQAPGLVHARHAFITDSGYDWNEAPTSKDGMDWPHAVRFSDGEKTAVILLDFDDHYVQPAEGTKRAKMTERLANAEKEFFEKQLALDDAAKEAAKKTQRK